MARHPRLFLESTPAHIVVRGNDRQAIFRSDGDRIYFHKNLSDLAVRHGLAVHAYVLMTNHVHILATPERSTSVPATLQSLGRRYVRYFNDLHNRTGTLWEGRYKAALVETERYYFTCQRYIELNPVRAGMVGDPSQHAWSSYRHHAWGRGDDLVTRHALHLNLGNDEEERRHAYLAMFEEDIGAGTLQRIRNSIQKGWPLGGKAFCDEVEARSGLRATPLSAGRKRKAASPALEKSGSESQFEMGL